MNSKELKQRLSFLQLLDEFKHIERKVFLKGDKRPETDAEHTWHTAMFFMLFESYFKKYDVLKIYKLILIHDLVEIYAGDTFAFDKTGNISKKERETKAAKKLFAKLPKELGKLFHDLFNEFEANSTPEGRIAKSFDKLQPMLQVIICNGGAWKKHKVTFEDIRSNKDAFMQHDETINSIYNELLKNIQSKKIAYEK